MLKQDVIEEKEDLKADETKEDALENVIEKEQNDPDQDQGYIYIKFDIMYSYVLNKLIDSIYVEWFGHFSKECLVMQNFYHTLAY